MAGCGQHPGEHHAITSLGLHHPQDRYARFLPKRLDSQGPQLQAESELRVHIFSEVWIRICVPIQGSSSSGFDFLNRSPGRRFYFERSYTIIAESVDETAAAATAGATEKMHNTETDKINPRAS